METRDLLRALGTSSDDIDLDEDSRRAVIAALPNPTARLRMELGALRTMQAPRLRRSEQGAQLTATLEALEHLTEKRTVSKKALRALIDTGIELAEAASDDPLLVAAALATAAAAESAFVGTAKTSPRSTDVLDHDASFFVACFHAGGPPASTTSNAERRRAFWQWWLEALVPWARTGAGTLRGLARAPSPRARPTPTAAPSRAKKRATEPAKNKPATATNVPSRLATWSAGPDAVEHLVIEQTNMSSWEHADEVGLLGLSKVGSPSNPFAVDHQLWSVVGSSARVIASSSNALEVVTADPERAYFWNQGALHAADRHAASASETLASGPTLAERPYALGVDASHLYWTTEHGLHSVAKAGGTPRTLSALICPRGLATSDQHVYVAELDESAKTGAGILQIPKAGGAATLLVRASVGKIALRGDELFWTEPQKSKTRLRVVRVGASATPKPAEVLSRPMVAGQFGTVIAMSILLTEHRVFVGDCRPGGHILAAAAKTSAKTSAKLEANECARFGSFHRVRLLGVADGRVYVCEEDAIGRFAV